MVAKDRADDTEKSSLNIMQIRWLWREQWPFKVSKSHKTNFSPNARYILPEMRLADVCFAAAGADFAAAGAFCF